MDREHFAKRLSRNYSQYISRLAPKQMSNSHYSKSILEFLNSLAQLPLNTCVSIVFQALSHYIDYQRSHNHYDQGFQEMLSKPDPILANFEWALNTTIKEHKYQRLAVFSGPSKDENLASTISSVACQLQHDDATDFIGELAGAWILTYPIDAIRKYEDVLLPIDWATNEDDYILVLSRHFDVEIEEWRR